MENFSSLKFLQDAGTIDVRDRAPESHHEEDDQDDDDDSYFELVLNAPENHLTENKIERKTDLVKGATAGGAKSPIALLKSAPKFRVLFHGFRKSKPEKTIQAIPATQKHQLLHKSPESIQSKRFAVEYDVVEEVRIASLFSRDKLHSEHASESPPKSPKDFPKYLNLIKPFYVRASKRYYESSRRSSDRSSTDSPWSSPAANSPMGKRGGGSGFRALSKHLAKSRSASSTIRMTPSPAAVGANCRRDDSLMLQNDGIQSAIQHCKRSLYQSEISTLWCSETDPATGKTETPASNATVAASMRCTSI